nr:MAG TPA: intron associated endonuclease [Crassvirales sp.]
MKVNKNDLNKCGIYCIRNIVNQKVYIGKSKNIYTRICTHISSLRRKTKDENRHLINA